MYLKVVTPALWLEGLRVVPILGQAMHRPGKVGDLLVLEHFGSVRQNVVIPGSLTVDREGGRVEPQRLVETVANIGQAFDVAAVDLCGADHSLNLFLDLFGRVSRKPAN